MTIESIKGTVKRDGFWKWVTRLVALGAILKCVFLVADRMPDMADTAVGVTHLVPDVHEMKVDVKALKDSTSIALAWQREKTPSFRDSVIRTSPSFVALDKRFDTLERLMEKLIKGDISERAYDKRIHGISARE
jgi:hypothetical protein